MCSSELAKSPLTCRGRTASTPRRADPDEPARHVEASMPFVRDTSAATSPTQTSTSPPVSGAWTPAVVGEYCIRGDMRLVRLGRRRRERQHVEHAPRERDRAARHRPDDGGPAVPVSYTHLRAHETDSYL